MATNRPGCRFPQRDCGRTQGLGQAHVLELLAGAVRGKLPAHHVLLLAEETAKRSQVHWDFLELILRPIWWHQAAGPGPQSPLCSCRAAHTAAKRPRAASPALPGNIQLVTLYSGQPDLGRPSSAQLQTLPGVLREPQGLLPVGCLLGPLGAGPAVGRSVEGGRVLLSVWQLGLALAWSSPAAGEGVTSILSCPAEPQQEGSP